MVTDNTATEHQKVVMVTGGASGIGAATVRLLARLGYTPVVMDVQDHLGRNIADEVNGTYLHHDVSRLDQWQQNLRLTLDRYGSVFGLVNAAGIKPEYSFAEPNAELFAQVLAVNLIGVSLGTQVLGEHMRNNGSGSIVNISSGSAMPPSRSPDLAYSSSKWGVRGVSRVASVALAPDGVRVNTILPGLIDTPMTEGIKDADPARIARFTQAIPMRRLGEASDIARAVYFFISDLGQYCVGAELLVDGGLGA